MDNQETKTLLLNQLATYSNMIDESKKEITRLTLLIGRLERHYHEIENAIKIVNQRIVTENVQKQLIETVSKEE